MAFSRVSSHRRSAAAILLLGGLGLGSLGLAGCAYYDGGYADGYGPPAYAGGGYVGGYAPAYAYGGATSVIYGASRAEWRRGRDDDHNWQRHTEYRQPPAHQGGGWPTHPGGSYHAGPNNGGNEYRRARYDHPQTGG